MRVRSIVSVIVLATIAVSAVSLVELGGFGTRTEPSVVEHWLARAARHYAVPRAGRDASNPVPFSSEVWAEARAHFADHCASCHANDGSGRTELGRSLYPKAPDMRLAGTQKLSDGEIYWIIENGIRLTGMPAWGDGSGQDTDTWELVHFIRRLDELSEAQLDEMKALNPRTPSEFEEEQQDREFLEGKEPASSSSAAPHHQHKE